MKNITKQQINQIFVNLFVKNGVSFYVDCNELSSTLLAENAQQELGVLTESGDSEIEELIFDLAVDFENTSAYKAFLEE